MGAATKMYPDCQNNLWTCQLINEFRKVYAKGNQMWSVPRKCLCLLSFYFIDIFWLCYLQFIC